MRVFSHTMKTEESSRPLRRSEIAQRLGVSESTIRQWMRRKVIPYVQIGYVILFDEKKVRRALDRFERQVGEV